MKVIAPLWIVLFVTSCSGIKVLKEPPPQHESKQGITLNGPAIGPVTVEKVGFWCEVKHGLLTFGAFGETEQKATDNAREKCHGMFKDSPCELTSCKPA